MTRRILFAAVLLLLIIGAGTAWAAPKYQLRCRGPLSYAVGTGQNTTVIFFDKNATKSGDGGLKLLPGT